MPDLGCVCVCACVRACVRVCVCEAVLCTYALSVQSTSLPHSHPVTSLHVHVYMCILDTMNIIVCMNILISDQVL